MNRRQRVLGWLLAPVSRAYVIVLFLLVCGVAGGAWELVSHDEHSACVIQARGLPAGHELAQSMRGIHMLLTLPATSEAERLAAANTPPEVRRIERRLTMHLAAYLKAEDAQPATRHC